MSYTKAILMNESLSELICPTPVKDIPTGVMITYTVSVPIKHPSSEVEALLPYSTPVKGQLAGGKDIEPSGFPRSAPCKQLPSQQKNSSARLESDLFFQLSHEANVLLSADHSRKWRQPPGSHPDAK